MPLQFISYATTGPYEADLAAMRASAERFSLDLTTVVRPPLERWEHGCAWKARVLLAARMWHPNDWLCWVDADARFCQYPQMLFELTGQPNLWMAAHWFRDRELISALVLFSPHPGATGLLRAWEAACREDPAEWDQKHLQEVADPVRPERLYRLPPEYGWIDAGDPKRRTDLSAKYYPNAGPPVIVQTQASRRLKQGAL